MTSLVKKSIFMTLILAAITCVIYPAAVWIVGQVVFRQKANGSVVYRNGQPVGSKLIAQGFARPEYFHPRPSAAGEKGYDGANSGATNFSLTNKKYQDALDANIKKALLENPQLQKGQIPPDMVTTSASGLDPHISPENARLQVGRVAKARGVAEDIVKKLVTAETHSKTILGDGFVNVLELNLALDEKFPLRK